MTHLDQLYLIEVAQERAYKKSLTKKKHPSNQKTRKRAIIKHRMSFQNQHKRKSRVSRILWKRTTWIAMRTQTKKTLMNKILIPSLHSMATVSNSRSVLFTCWNMTTGLDKSLSGSSCTLTSITPLSVWSSWILCFWDASTTNRSIWTCHLSNKTQWISLLTSLKFTSLLPSESSVFPKSLEWASSSIREVTLETHGIGLILWLLLARSWLRSQRWSRSVEWELSDLWDHLEVWQRCLPWRFWLVHFFSQLHNLEESCCWLCFSSWSLLYLEFQSGLERFSIDAEWLNSQ